MRPPPAVRAVATQERRIAWSVLADGGVLVATSQALYDGTTRLAWTDVERVRWSPPVLTVVEAAPVEGTGPARVWQLDVDHQLAETVRACVLASVVWSERRALSPAGAVRLVGRRVPGQEALGWQLVWQPGTDPEDPALVAQAEAMVLGLRKTIG